MSVSVLLHSEYGVPEFVIQSSSYLLPNLEADQVHVRTLFSPINPADLNMMEGKYYVQPELPCVLGNEGVGVVEAVGSAVVSFKKGDRVIMPIREKSTWVGWWADSFITKEATLVLVPDFVSDEQASMLTVNPVTAYQLLTRFIDLEPSDYVLLNAGNSAVSRWIIAFCEAMGLKTIVLVRRQDVRLVAESWGADYVLIDEPGVSKKIREISSVKLALNAVGGQSAKELGRSLARDGVLVTYGAMSKEPVCVGNSAFIYDTVWATGFNRSKWVEEAHPQEVRDAYSHVFNLLESKFFEVPVEKIYSYSQIVEALKHASQVERKGKILISF